MAATAVGYKDMCQDALCLQTLLLAVDSVGHVQYARVFFLDQHVLMDEFRQLAQNNRDAIMEFQLAGMFELVAFQQRENEMKVTPDQAEAFLYQALMTDNHAVPHNPGIQAHFHAALGMRLCDVACFQGDKNYTSARQAFADYLRALAGAIEKGKE